MKILSKNLIKQYLTFKIFSAFLRNHYGLKKLMGIISG